MSIKSAIEHSLDDVEKPSKKSYAKCQLKFTLMQASDILAKEDKTDAEERFVKDELLHENIEQIIFIEDKNRKGITVWQIKDLFNDIGFNTDVQLAAHHYADINAVYNVGGYLIPYYKKLISLVFTKSRFRKLFLYKLVPGLARLHIRLFDNGTGSWFLTSHIDEANWMNIFRIKFALKKHFKRGEGDYETGTKVMDKVLQEVSNLIESDTEFDIDANKYL